jgi:hypothetical protein
MPSQEKDDPPGTVPAEKVAIQCRKYYPQPLPGTCLDRDAHFSGFVIIRFFGKWGRKET